MDLVQLADAAYQLKGGSNAGLIVRDGQAVLVDTGLDKDAAKKILRHVDALKVRLAAVIITHAHADHFGGAATIKARTGAPVYAPALEAAIVENPLIEPLYLYSGAMPPAELRHKFTLADACAVDHILESGELAVDGVPLHIVPAPGHAPNQMVVGGGGVCFVADAVFAPEVLDKHVIPFFVDIDQWQATLTGMEELAGHYAAFVPGHGSAVSELGPWLAWNSDRLARIRAAVFTAVESCGGELAEIVRATAATLKLDIPNPVSYWLTQTPVLACLASLRSAGAATIEVVDNRLIWRASPRSS